MSLDLFAESVKKVQYAEADCLWRELVAKGPDALTYVALVLAWLDAGELGRARAVYGTVPALLQREITIQRLRVELEYAEEAFELQGAVRPPLSPGDLPGWEPRLLRAELGCRPLKGWYAGRVEALEDGRIAVRAATPLKSVLVRWVTLAEWAQWSGGSCLPEIGTFFELGLYEDEPTLVVLRCFHKQSGV